MGAGGGAGGLRPALAARGARGARAAGDAGARALRLQACLAEVLPPGRGGAGARLRRRLLRCGAEEVYPASCVKVAAAALALRRLAALRALADAPELSVRTGLVFHRRRPGEAGAGEAAVNLGLLLRRVFLVSDNEAHNLLLDFAGRARANASLARAGVDVRLRGSLGAGRGPPRCPARSVEVLAPSGPFSVRLDDGAAGDGGAGGRGPPAPWSLGSSHVTAAGALVREPLPMAGKSSATLLALQDLLVLLLRPTLADAGEEWLLDGCERPEGGGGPGGAARAAALGLEPRDLAFLSGAMAETCPGSPPLPEAEGRPEDHNKFFLRGLRAALGPNVTVRNKLGQAYGFSLDNAHVVWEDGPRGPVEFFLAACVYTNANETLNDDAYEYEDLGEPLLEDIARAAGEVVRRSHGAP